MFRSSSAPQMSFSPRLQLLLWLALAMAAAFALGFPFLNLPFYQDDFAFFHPASIGFYGSKVSSFVDIGAFWNPTRGWFYRPTFLHYMALGIALWGQNPVPFHVLGLVLHGSVVFLLGVLAFRLSRSQKVGVACGAAFLLWPGKNEAVWWIASHSALLAALFSLLTLHLWISFRQKAQRRFFALALLCFWLALCSKFDAVPLIVALVLLDALILRPCPWKKMVGSWLPFAGVLVLYLACEATASRYYATHGDKFVSGLLALSPGERLHYPVSFAHIAVGRVLSPVSRGWHSLLLVGAFVGALRILGRGETGRVLLFFVGWSLAGVSATPLAVGPHSLSERMFYVPLLPLAGALVLLLVCLWNHAHSAGEEGLAALVALAAFGSALVSRLVPLRVLDPVTHWQLLFGTVALALVLWRMREISVRFLVCVATVALGSQLAIYVFPDAQKFVFLPCLAVCMSAMGQRGWWSGAMLTILAWTTPLWVLPLALACCVAVRRVQGHRLRMRVQQARSFAKGMASLQ